MARFCGKLFQLFLSLWRHDDHKIMGSIVSTFKRKWIKSKTHRRTRSLTVQKKTSREIKWSHLPNKILCRTHKTRNTYRVKNTKTNYHFAMAYLFYTLEFFTMVRLTCNLYYRSRKLKRAVLRHQCIYDFILSRCDISLWCTEWLPYLRDVNPCEIQNDCRVYKTSIAKELKKLRPTN